MPEATAASTLRRFAVAVVVASSAARFFASALVDNAYALRSASALLCAACCSADMVDFVSAVAFAALASAFALAFAVASSEALDGHGLLRQRRRGWARARLRRV